MEYCKRFLRVLLVFVLANLALLETLAPPPDWLTLPLLFGLLAYYLWFHIRPRRAKGATRRLRALLGGYELLLVAFFVILAEMAFYPLLLATGALHRAVPALGAAPDWVFLAANLLLFVPLVGALLVNGFFRVLLTSKHLRVVWRVLLLLCWWVPLFNLYLFYRVLKAVRHEYYFELSRLENEAVHAENRDCETRYPIVLVHGIFFRDWQLVNYWGRIPRALTRCGATVFYGGQQSALPVAQSAAELAERLQAVLRETGAEKVNLIAHSKGGLDSRYAITRLGLAPHVASLTTVNTPHRGCIFAEELLRTLPKGVIAWMERRYNGLFRTLGDASPDFLGGVRDLTRENCLCFNRETPDQEGVFYQSVMSTMQKPSSAGFPLNLTWHLVRKYDREANDGLVARSSAEWGHFLGNLSASGRRGVSHGDVVDLMREDIPGFDVREFYIGLVKGLKEKGF